MNKRIIACLLSLVMLFSMVPVQALATEVTPAEPPVVSEEELPAEETTEATEAAPEETEAPAVPEETQAPAEPEVPQETGAPAEPEVPQETEAPAEPEVPQETEAPAEPEQIEEPESGIRSVPMEGRKYQNITRHARKIVKKTVKNTRLVHVFEEQPDGSVKSYDKTVTKEYEVSSLEPIHRIQNEEGYITRYFSTFEELKQLCETAGFEWCDAYYEGEGPLVIPEDFTMQDVTLCFAEDNSSLLVPEGVTFTNNGGIQVDTLTIAGQLYNDGYIYCNKELAISGSLLNNADISVLVDTVITGIENLQNLEEWSNIYLENNCRTKEELIAAAADSLNYEGKANWTYSIWVLFQEDVVLDSDLRFATNSSLEISSSFKVTLAEGSTWEQNCEDIFIYYAPVQIDGTLINSGTINVYHYDGASMSFAGPASYSGKGAMQFEVNDESLSAEELVPGLDMSKLYCVYNGNCWIIRDNTGMTQLGTPTDLTWGKALVWDDESGQEVLVDAPGHIAWKSAMPDQGSVEVSIWKENPEDSSYEWLESYQWGFYTDSDEPVWHSIDTFAHSAPESGNYFFTVQSLAEDSDYFNSEVAKSEVYSYTKPSKKLEIPTNLRWGEEENGEFYARWDSADKVFEITWYYASEMGKEPEWIDQIRLVDVGNTAHDVNSLTYEYGNGYYYFSIRAISDNIEEACASEWSELSAPYYYFDSLSYVSNALDAILNGEQTPAAVRAAMKELDPDHVKSALLRDADGEIRNKLGELETLAGDPPAIQIKNNAAEFAAGQITIEGAALNTPVSADQEMLLVVDQAAAKHELGSKYEPSTAASFSMKLTNVADSEALDVPVIITMPIPADIHPSLLHVFTYDSNGNKEEQKLLEKTTMFGQTYITMVLTGLGDLVFAAERFTQEDMMAEIQAAVDQGDYDYALTKPVTLTKDLNLNPKPGSYFEIIISDGGSITVPEGITLTHECGISLLESSKLIVKGVVKAKDGHSISVMSGTIDVKDGADVQGTDIYLWFNEGAQVLGVEKSHIHACAEADTYEDFEHFVTIAPEYLDMQVVTEAGITLEKDLVLSEKFIWMVHSSENAIIVPAGVTLTNNGWITIFYNTELLVQADATLVNNGTLELTGSTLNLQGNYSGTGSVMVDGESHVLGTFVTIEASQTELSYGKIAELSAQILPLNLTDTDIVWEVINGSEYITFTPNGRYATVAAKAVEESQGVVIRASAADGSARDTTIMLTITPPSDEKALIALCDYTRLLKGQKTTLTPVLNNGEALNGKVTWTLAEDHGAYATLTQKNNVATVTAKAVTEKQTVRVIATYEDETVLPTFLELTVYPPVEKIYIYSDQGEVSGKTISFDLNKAPADGYNEKEMALMAIANPSEAEELLGNLVKWESSDAAIATVNEHGLVTFTGQLGKVKLTAKATDNSGKSASVTVNVVKNIQSIEMVKDTATQVLSGKSVTLKVCDSATKAELKSSKIQWILSDEYDAYASITASGKLTAKNVGQKVDVQVLAILKDNPNASVTHTVAIYPAVTQVEIFADGSQINGTMMVDTAEREEVVLSAKVYPTDAMTKTVKWSDSDKKDAYATYTTNEKGELVIKPKGTAGTVTITATAQDGTKKAVSVKVKLGVFAKSVEVENTETTLVSGSKLTLSAVAKPDNVSDKNVTWSLKNSEDKAYVTLSKNKLTAKTVYEPTQVTLLATSKDGCAEAEYTITIEPKNTKILVIRDGEGQNVTKSTVLLDYNETKSVALKVCDYGTMEAREATWKSSNTRTATVDNGVVTFKKEGSVTITAKIGKQSATVTVKAVKLASDVSIENADKGLKVISGKSITLKPILTDASGSKVTWSIVDGEAFATINAKGKLTAAKNITSAKTVTVRATAADGSGLYGEAVVTVLPIAQSVEIFEGYGVVLNNTQHELDMYAMPQLQLYARVYPFYGGESDMNAVQAVKWGTSSSKLATVDENGLVTFHKTGTVTITATATDNSGKKASFKIKVVKLVSQIEIADAFVAGGKKLTIKPVIGPKDATNKGITWRVVGGEGREYASISAKGVLTTKKVTAPKVVVVQAIAKDGGGCAAYGFITIYPATTKVAIWNNGENVTGKTINAEAGTRFQLDAVSNPINAAGIYTWKSSNTKCATVDENGVVTVLKKSSKPITITATAKDGTGVKATVKLKIS